VIQKLGCGTCVRMGHGENVVCGETEEYYREGVWLCVACETKHEKDKEIDKLEKELDELKAVLSQVKNELKTCNNRYEFEPCFEFSISQSILEVLEGAGNDEIKEAEK